MNKILTGAIVVMFFVWVGVLSAEQKKIIGKDGASMVLIPAGEFTMGSPQGGGENEHPQHKVYLNTYYIDKYEVTVAQYRKFCEETRREMPKVPYWGWQDNQPIVNVTWDDAVAYANYYGKRLPTEAEWEKACRGGTTTAFHYGNSLNSDQVNFSGDYPYGGASEGVYRKKTTSVGSFQPNAFNLYDMHGNASEWCSDWYDMNYYKNSPTKNPTGPTSGHDRVLRGGGWCLTAEDCRSARRLRFVPIAECDYLGFRCVFSP